MIEVTFQNVVFLWFLTLIPLLVAVHFYSLHYVRQKAMRFANFEALQKIVAAKEVVPGNYLLLVMRIMTLVGFTLAASGITLHYDTIGTAYDYMIAVDSSSSMLAEDVKPTRMQAATAAVSDWLASTRLASKVGVAQFSSQADVLLAPTQDLAEAGRKVKSIVPDKSGGTAICEAIKSSVNQFPQISINPRAIVLLSDGQNNAGCLLDDGIDYAKKNGVTVFTIGIGSREGGTIEGVKDVVFGFDDDDLKRAAEQTGGKYFRVEREGDFGPAFSELSMPFARTETLPLAVPVMLMSFFFVFVDWGLSITRYRTIP